MNFSSISTARSATVALVISGIVFFGISGMAYARGNNTSGQSGHKKEDPGDYSDKNDPIPGHTGELYSEKGSSIKGRRVQKSEIPRIVKLLYEESPKIAAKGESTESYNRKEN